MQFSVQDLLEVKEVEYHIKGETLYYLNDSNESCFFYDSSCKIRSEKSFGEYLKMINFFLACFNIDSVNPQDIVFKIKINSELNLIQFEKAFSRKKIFFTDKICKNYLKNRADFRYGYVRFLNTFQRISFSKDDFLEEQIDSFVSKDFLKLSLMNKVCKIKPYLSDADISFFKINLEEEFRI